MYALHPSPGAIGRLHEKWRSASDATHRWGSSHAPPTTPPASSTIEDEAAKRQIASETRQKPSLGPECSPPSNLDASDLHFLVPWTASIPNH